MISRACGIILRRSFKAKCGNYFKFDRPFMACLKDGKPKTMADAADAWLRITKKYE